MIEKNKKMVSIFLIILFTIISFMALFPLLALIVSSFRPSVELMRNGISFDISFSDFSLENYRYIFTSATQYWRWYGNSLIVTTLSVLLALFFSSMVGYGLGVYKFKGRNIIFLCVLLTMMIPFEIMMLPLYELMIDLGLINSYLGIILPSIVAVNAVFFFRQYAASLPLELMDAARIDGSTEYGIFFKIMMPMMKPSFGAMTILLGLNNWNNFLWPLLVIRSNDLFTLPIGLQTLVSPYESNYDVLITGAVLSVLPIVILFIAFQKYFISGLTAGGVKG
jgi:arabinosaccharide transport system permease protein